MMRRHCNILVVFRLGKKGDRIAVLHYMTTTRRDREHRLWYGVAAMQGGRVQERLDGLTMDSGSIRRLVQRLNDGHASLMHFTEIAEDFLAHPLR